MKSLLHAYVKRTASLLGSGDKKLNVSEFMEKQLRDLWNLAPSPDSN
ncbi:hypothetical protein 0305phi8-36p065 [Bacillus phage 0305phi8-36]|nr:hypothetical protein ST0305phi8-36p065 [Bacillus phage 0305phi8-36]ABS83625.1 hypothetical protein 0305phi8-36p065 [Bacillus phage 0305phi8-36]